MKFFKELCEEVINRLSPSSNDLSIHTKVYNPQLTTIFSDSLSKASEEREKLFTTRKHLISKILSEQNIIVRIEMLSDGDKYYSDMSKKDIDTLICWDNVFTKTRESQITRFCKRNNIEDDFVIRLWLLIEELHYEKYEHYKYGSDIASHAIEMINNLQFLKDNYVIHFFESKNEIIELVLELLLLHYLEAVVSAKDYGTKSKIDETILRIKKLDKALRKLISAKSKSFAVLNNVFEGIPNACFSFKEISIPSVARSFAEKNFISCHGSKIKTPVSARTILQCTLLHIRFEEAINMEEIYEKFEILKTNWEGGKYTKYECNFIAYIDIVELCGVYPALKAQINTIVNILTAYKQHLYLIDEHKSTSFYVALLPDYFIDIAIKQCSEDISCSCGVFYPQVMKFFSHFKKHLIYTKMNESSIGFFCINPKEMVDTIKTISDCYNVYFKFKYEKSKEIKDSISYYLEASCDIIKIISNHLEKLDSSAFNNDIHQYIKLLFEFKKITSDKSKLSNQKIESKTISDYPLLLKFYERYHRHYLRIDCIYNICFVLGKSSNGTDLRLYPINHKKLKESMFYTAADAFLEYLRSINYNINKYDEEIYDTLDHIMKCLVEINQGNFKNTIHSSFDIKHKYLNNTHNLEAKNSDIDARLCVIDEEFWSKLELYLDETDTFKQRERYNCSFMHLYKAKYISKTDVDNLYNVCCAFVDSNAIGLLKIGVINRKSTEKLRKVTCNMIGNAFVLIWNSKKIGEDAVRGLNCTQFLFRVTDFSKMLNYKNHAFRSITGSCASEDDVRHYSEVLGVYGCFEDIPRKYLTIHESITSMKTGLSDNKDIKDITKFGYKVLIKCFSIFDRKISKTIENPGIMLDDFGLQLSITLEAIASNDNHVVIASKLLNFVSNNTCSKDIHLLIDYIIPVMKLLSGPNCHKILESNLENLPYEHLVIYKMALYMIELALRKAKTIPAKELFKFFTLVCSFTCEVQNYEETSEISENVIVSRYMYLREQFTKINNSIGGLQGWLTLYHQIKTTIKRASKSTISEGKTWKLIMTIRSSLDRYKNNSTGYSTFIIDSSLILEIFIFNIKNESKDHSAVDSQLFVTICSLLEQDSTLMRILNYESITGDIECKDCYICCEAKRNPVKIINCVCKSHALHLACSIEFEFSRIRDQQQNPDIFAPVCSICRMGKQPK